MAGMDTTTTTHDTLWEFTARPERLDPFSPLAQNVLKIDAFPAVLGWKLGSHRIHRITVHKPTAFEVAHQLALTGHRP